MGGAVLGAALAAGVAVFLTSKKGTKLRAGVREQLEDFYAHIAPKLKELKKMGKEEYEAFITDAAKHYGKTKKLSEAKIKEIIQEAKKSWKHVMENFES